MQTFRVSHRWSRWTRLFWGAFFLGLGAISLMMGVVMLWQGQLSGLVPLVVGYGFSSGAWDGLVHGTYEIRVSRLGVIEFVRPLRTIRVAAWDIYNIEGVRSRDCEGCEVWSMHVRHRPRRRFTVAHFERATAFLMVVQAHHPAVRISGEWPVLMPRRRTAWRRSANRDG
jgi:hypothetical protein